jgi:hypothetical protein
MTGSGPREAVDRVSAGMLRMLVVWALIVIGAVSIIQYASGPPEEY